MRKVNISAKGAMLVSNDRGYIACAVVSRRDDGRRIILPQKG